MTAAKNITPATSCRKPSEDAEDADLKDELRLLVEKIVGKDKKLIIPSLEMLKFLIRTSTTSMTSVPKPLKYLVPYYARLKEAHSKMEDPVAKKKCADIISVLAMGPSADDKSRDYQDCLRYCLLGTQTGIGDWGHEYLRQLENEIVDRWVVDSGSAAALTPLVRDVVKYDCRLHAEIQACDLLMEIDRLEMLPQHLCKDTYEKICLYLSSCAKYVDEIEAAKIMDLVSGQYLRFGEYGKALTHYMQMGNVEMVNKIFEKCKDPTMLLQLAFMIARQLFVFELSDNVLNKDELMPIMSNAHLSSYFQNFARDLDIMEPKRPDEVYKTWLEQTPQHRRHVLGENVDSARQNLASSFVNGFVNAGFGRDKILTVAEVGNRWIYRNKQHGMVSATASLGLIHLWDVDGGLTPIDKYLYTNVENVKAGALLALGLVNCRVRNECDPALALLAEYIEHSCVILKIQALFGLGMAYIGTKRRDVLDLLIPSIESAHEIELISIASLSAGLVALGSCNADVTNAILAKLLDVPEKEDLKTSHVRLALLGLSFCYMGRRDVTDAVHTAFEVFTEPFRSTAQTILKFCAYAGTGDVLVIQELLRAVDEKVEGIKAEPEVGGKGKDRKAKTEWDLSIPQAVACLGVSVVSLGEEIGMEMVQRILGNAGRYGDAGVRRVVPLAIALASVSNPQLHIVDILTKYSHDSDEEVACNAIFSLGLLGAGSNNARLAACLRQMATYHARNPSQLFMVRLAQGLIHMAKGAMTLNPIHSDRLLLDLCALAGLLIPIVALLEPHALILGSSHYLLYGLAAAMQPRWLLTLDENLVPVQLPVRVGQAVDVVGKAGTPKTIVGTRTHNTPVLLTAGERAEMATEEYQTVGPLIEGVCIVRKRD